MQDFLARAAAPVFLGLIVGVMVCLLALGLSGAGHGWNSAFISAVSLVGAPLAGLAWALRDRTFGLLLAIAVLMGAIGFDMVLWLATQKEGTNFVRKAWEHGPGFVLLWGAMFASWQLLAAATPLCHRRARELGR